VPYLTFIDAFFLLTFIFSCISLVELIAVHQSLERGFLKHANRLRILSKYLGPLLYVTLIGIAAAVFFLRTPHR
jgi:hypothetical protein